MQNCWRDSSENMPECKALRSDTACVALLALSVFKT